MIFVTVGTHEQPFNRLVRAVDDLKADGTIPADERVFIQTGFSTYEPQHCEWAKLLPYEDMQSYIQKARIVITHGGPSSFLAPLQLGKIPIVMPRHVEYGEHVNNHQVEFAKDVAKRFGNIIVVDDKTELAAAIADYDHFIINKTDVALSNNLEFCKAFARVVDELFVNDSNSGRERIKHDLH